MKYYQNYTAKKFKLPRRLLFFVIIALVIVVATVILGNVLRSRLNNADINTSPIDTTAPDETQDQAETTGPVTSHDSALSAVKAQCLNFTGISEASDVRSLVADAQSAGANAVSFSVNNGEGMSAYASPALEKFSGLAASQSLVPYNTLKTAADAAKASGLRLCAIMTKTGRDSDALVAAELEELGFDELTVCGYGMLEKLDNETVAAICGYLDSLRRDGSMDIALCLPESIYKAAYNAPYIEKLYQHADFLAIDMTSSDAAGAKETAESLQGSFTAYLLRPLLDGMNAERAVDIKNALASQGVKTYMFINAPERVKDSDTTDSAQGTTAAP